MNRRKFLKYLGLATTASLFNNSLMKNTFANVKSKSLEFGNRVVWVHDEHATFWENDGYYGNYVNQNRVNQMISDGIKSLTSESDVNVGWQSIINGYTEGDIIGIKININNSSNGNAIDAVAAPIIGIVSGLTSCGVREQDIYIIEPSREFSSRIADPIIALFPNVLLWDSDGSYNNEVTYNYATDASTTVIHTNPGLTGDNRYSYMPEQLEEIKYLINVPIMKGHGAAEFSLTFKNNFGMLKKWTVAKLHDYSLPGRPGYSYDTNPLHDIYLNSNIKDKTVLIIGDGLFCSRVETAAVPQTWKTFNDSFPNSIFLSTDPVAIDSVMFDFLNAESSRSEESQLYLHRAEELGLGVHDHWNNPLDRQYTKIDFRKIGSGKISRYQIDQIIKEYKDGDATNQEVKVLLNQYLKGE